MTVINRFNQWMSLSSIKALPPVIQR